MRRPSRLEILEYALEGVNTLWGTQVGALTEWEEEELEDHREWLKDEIKRVKEKQNG